MKHLLVATITLLRVVHAGGLHEHPTGQAQLHEIQHDATSQSSDIVNDTCASGSLGCTNLWSALHGEVTSALGLDSKDNSSTVTPESLLAEHVAVSEDAFSDNTGAQLGPDGAREINTSADDYHSNSLYAMAYTPYKHEDDTIRCATVDEVSSDIASIASKGFKAVRIYATDCGGLVHVGDACKAAGLRMIVGIFVDSDGLDSDEVSEQILDVKDYFNGDYSNVDMVLLGNEVLFHNWANASHLADSVSALRRELRTAGYDGPVSTADTVAGLSENQDILCDSVDVLAANIHPFFDHNISAASAGLFVSNQLSTLKGLCGGSKIAINSETGWPSNGQANGEAIPSRAEQALAIESIKRAVGGESVFFSFENDYWKGSGHLDTDSHWGCANVFAS